MTRTVPYEQIQLPLAVSLGAVVPATVGWRDLPVLMRAADAAMYAGKHTGTVVQAGPEHTGMPSINGRHAGRPGISRPDKVARPGSRPTRPTRSDRAQRTAERKKRARIRSEKGSAGAERPPAAAGPRPRGVGALLP